VPRSISIRTLHLSTNCTFNASAPTEPTVSCLQPDNEALDVELKRAGRREVLGGVLLTESRARRIAGGSAVSQSSFFRRLRSWDL
jgi:hypothetical protein